jgi:hypothetical protein
MHTNWETKDYSFKVYFEKIDYEDVKWIELPDNMPTGFVMLMMNPWLRFELLLLRKCGLCSSGL